MVKTVVSSAVRGDVMSGREGECEYGRTESVGGWLRGVRGVDGYLS